MTGEPSIDYESLTQNAMRSVVQAVLARTATSGLPGEHHFYISFDTQAENVAISKRLKEKYPQEMTVVLQHRFWDLNVYDDHFEVKLTFDGIPERLVVPYKSIKVFFDPSVRYGLQFEDQDFNSESIDRTMTPLEMADLMKPRGDEDISADESPTHQQIHTKRIRPAPDSNSQGDDIAHASDDERAPSPTKSAKSRKASKSDEAAASAKVEDGASNDAHSDNISSAEIVSLDAFRKK